MALIQNISALPDSSPDMITRTSPAVRRTNEPIIDTPYSVVISLGGLIGRSPDDEATVNATKFTPVLEVLRRLLEQERLGGVAEDYELAETILSENVVCKER